MAEEEGPPRRWGKAGERLDGEKAEALLRRRQAEKRRGVLRRQADDRVAYRMWEEGMVCPNTITHFLNARGLWGPEVDVACGAREPEVDLWEAGKLYPSWEQVKALANLTGTTPRLLCTRQPIIPMEATTLRFHFPDAFKDDPPPLWRFPDRVVAAREGTRLWRERLEGVPVRRARRHRVGPTDRTGRRLRGVEPWVGP